MILVTGASGFVGTHLCRRLLGMGRPFRALVRSPAKAGERGLPGPCLHRGDLLGPMDGALEGVRAVVHLAGLLRGSPKALRAVNRDGTRNLVGAMARRAPEARLVHLSSLAAFGPSEDGRGTDGPPEGARPVSHYGRSKLEAERVVQGASNPWMVLRPSIVYGPWDRDVLALVRQMGRGFGLLAGPPARYSLIHASDLAEALIRALDSPETGRFLPLAHPEPLGDRAWLKLLAEVQGRRGRVGRLPSLGGALAALCGEAFARLRGRAPLFGWDKFREMRAGSWVADPAPARALLGFRARIGHREGFGETVGWYRRRGWLPAGPQRR